MNRPNLITKSALVEQAYGLSKFEVDHPSKYDEVFGESKNACFAGPIVAMEAGIKERILRHYRKISAAKFGNKLESIAPSPELVSALRRVYGGDESHVLRSLLKSVMDHPVFSNQEGYDDVSPSSTFQMESLIAHVCGDNDTIPGLLIAILSLLTGLHPTEAKKPPEESEPTPLPILQVGSLLSILRPEEENKDVWGVDSEILVYLGQAAAAYEERTSLKKARLLKKLEQPHDATLQADADLQPPTLDVVAIPDEDVTDAAMSVAVLEHIVSAATGDESSSNEDQGDDSSESGSDRDSEYEESERQAQDNGSSSSSSSSSSSDHDPQDIRQPRPSQQDHVDSDDDDDVVLRQALALSLVDQAQSLRVDISTHEPSLQLEGANSEPITPGTETPISAKETFSSEHDDSPLPPLPVPPKFYPFVSASNTDPENVDESAYLDPSALNRFGSLPFPNVLIQLLRFVLEKVERQKFQTLEEPIARKHAPTISGGMGCSLFPPALHKPKPIDHGPEASVSLQLLVALVLLVIEKRNDAMENLRKAIMQERLAYSDHSELSDISPSSEGDDPAIALALNYLDEEASESLEAKGMRRKAAAAAHDAAALLKSLRRRTDSWKQRVHLFSHCSFLAMKCMRLYLQSVVRSWLQLRGLAAVDCHNFLPRLCFKTK